MRCPFPPASVSAHCADLVDLHELATRVVEWHRAAPCAAVGAARREGGRWRFGLGVAGRHQHRSSSPAATSATLFDLASLTKPLVALALARLERAGRLRRGETLAELLPALGGTPTAAAPIWTVAAHRAGLAAHREFFVPRAGAVQPDRATIIGAAARARRPRCVGLLPPEGVAETYSDLGYILLGAAVEAREAAAIDVVVAREVLRPLGLRIGSARQLALAAADVGEYLAAVAPTERVPWRGGLVHGVVHDENAWILSGAGMAGHAGAFGDVGAVVGLGVALLEALRGERPDWLTADELEPLVHARAGGTHGGGFDRRSGARPTSGRYFGPQTFGHLGFTGTSIWLDPDRELVGVLLSNRVCPSRDNPAIRRARPDVYDGIYRRFVG